VLAQLLPQLAQMIAMEPQTGAFCGEVLKFTVAPFRAGRSLDGAIDDLAELMKSKAEQPRGPDPTTIQAQTAKEIETMKIAHASQKDQGEAELKKQEMAMRDAHEKAKIASNEKLKLAELRARQGDDAAKAQQTQLKAIADREKHQADMLGKQADVQFDAQKLDHAKQLAQLKIQQTIQQGEQKRVAEQFKLQQAAMRPPPGRPGM
jgi:hypothetical protein